MALTVALTVAMAAALVVTVLPMVVTVTVVTEPLIYIHIWPPFLSSLCQEALTLCLSIPRHPTHRRSRRCMQDMLHSSQRCSESRTPGWRAWVLKQPFLAARGCTAWVGVARTRY